MGCRPKTIQLNEIWMSFISAAQRRVMLRVRRCPFHVCWVICISCSKAVGRNGEMGRRGPMKVRQPCICATWHKTAVAWLASCQSLHSILRQPINFSSIRNAPFVRSNLTNKCIINSIQDGTTFFLSGAQCKLFDITYSYYLDGRCHWTPINGA